MSPAFHTHVPSPSLSCIIYPPQSRAQGRILGNQSSPPASFSAKQIWYNSFRPISLLPFLPAGTLSQSRHPHCSAWVCPLASTWAQLQSICDPTRLRELPQQKLCVTVLFTLHRSPPPRGQSQIPSYPTHLCFTLPLLTFPFPPLLTSEFCSSVVSPVAPLASRLMLPSFVEVVFLFLCLAESNLHRN